MKYSLLRSGRWTGPFTEEQLQQKYQKGDVTLEDYIRPEASKTHIQIKSVESIANSRPIHPSFLFLPFFSGMDLGNLFAHSKKPNTAKLSTPAKYSVLFLCLLGLGIVGLSVHALNMFPSGNSSDSSAPFTAVMVDVQKAATVIEERASRSTVYNAPLKRAILSDGTWEWTGRGGVASNEGVRVSYNPVHDTLSVQLQDGRRATFQLEIASLRAQLTQSRSILAADSCFAESSF